jgi:hypothetical protein
MIRVTLGGWKGIRRIFGGGGFVLRNYSHSENSLFYTVRMKKDGLQGILVYSGELGSSLAVTGSSQYHHF